MDYKRTVRGLTRIFTNCVNLVGNDGLFHVLLKQNSSIIASISRVQLEILLSAVITFSLRSSESLQSKMTKCSS